MLRDSKRDSVTILQTDLSETEVNTIINNLRYIDLKPFGIDVKLWKPDRRRRYTLHFTSSEFASEPFQITGKGKVLFWPSDDNREFLKNRILFVIEKLVGHSIKVFDEKTTSLSPKTHAIKSELDRKAQNIEEDRATSDRQMHSEVMLDPTLQEQDFHHITVNSPITDLNFQDLSGYRLANINTLQYYRQHIPVEIKSKTSCHIWRIYLIRKRGIFVLAEKVKYFLFGEYSLKNSVKLMIEESLPIEVKPGKPILLHILTDSTLDINKEMEGDNVAIVVEHSYGKSESKTFSSANFWDYQHAINSEIYKHCAEIFLKSFVAEGRDPKELNERVKKFTADLGLWYYSFLCHLLNIAEEEKLSLGLSDELVEQIRANEILNSISKRILSKKKEGGDKTGIIIPKPARKWSLRDTVSIDLRGLMVSGVYLALVYILHLVYPNATDIIIWGSLGFVLVRWILRS
jgi:hypothetical protein